MSPSRPVRYASVLAAGLFPFLVSCAESATTSVPVPAALELAGDAALTGTVAQAPATLPQVRVLDEEGEPLSGAVVDWEIVAGAGSVENTTTSDEDGVARATWILGPAAGPQRLRASLGAGSAVDFTAAALAGPLDSLSILPTERLLSALGDTARLHLHATDAYGNAVSTVGTVWAVAGSAVVLADGIATAVSNGSASVTATLGLRTALSSFAVQQVPNEIEAAVPPAFDALGDSVQLIAAVLDRNRNSVPGYAIQWISLDTAVVAIDPAGLARARTPGAARLVATSGAFADTVIALVDPAVASLQLGGGSVTLAALHAEALLEVHARDANGNELADEAIEWSVEDTSVAVVARTAGLRAYVRAARNGSTRVVARVGDLQAFATLQVLQVAAAVVIENSVRMDAIGATQRLEAHVTDANGHAIGGALAVWTSSDTSVLGVAADGTINARANGVSVVRADVGALSDTSLVEVRQRTARLTLGRSVDSTTVGTPIHFEAFAFDRRDVAIVDPHVQWSSTDLSVLTVSAAGDVQPVDSGSARVIAMSDGVADTAVVTVRRVQAASLVRVSGDEQSGSINTTLPNELLVRVLDAGGVPLRNVEVTFGRGPDAASAVPDIQRTDSLGIARTQWTLNSLIGRQVLHARVTGTPLIATFHAYAGSAAAGGGVTVGVQGGSFEVDVAASGLGSLVFDVPAGSYANAVSFDVSVVAPPALPGFTQGDIVAALEVNDGGAATDSAITLRIGVPSSADEVVNVFWFDPATGTIKPATVGAQDTAGVEVLVSSFAWRGVAGAFPSGVSPRSSASSLSGLWQLVVSRVPANRYLGRSVNTDFVPGYHDWEFKNSGSWLATTGNCLAQILTALHAWIDTDGARLHYRYGPPAGERLAGFGGWENAAGYRYVSLVQRSLNNDVMVRGVIGRAWRHSIGQDDALDHARLIEALEVTGEPQLVAIWNYRGEGHVLLAIGAVADGDILVVDPNDPGNTHFLEYDASSGWETYDGRTRSDLDPEPFPFIRFISLDAFTASAWDRISGAYANFLTEVRGGPAQRLDDGYALEIYDEGQDIYVEGRTTYSAIGDSVTIQAGLALPLGADIAVRSLNHDNNPLWAGRPFGSGRRVPIYMGVNRFGVATYVPVVVDGDTTRFFLDYEVIEIYGAGIVADRDTVRWMHPGEAIDFSAYVSGAPDVRVSWSASGGAIDDAGRYVAGATTGWFAAIASSVFDPALVDTVHIEIRRPAALVWAADGSPVPDTVIFYPGHERYMRLVYDDGTRIPDVEIAKFLMGTTMGFTQPNGDTISFLGHDTIRVTMAGELRSGTMQHQYPPARFNRNLHYEMRDSILQYRAVMPGAWSATFTQVSPVPQPSTSVALTLHPGGSASGASDCSYAGASSWRVVRDPQGGGVFENDYHLVVINVDIGGGRCGSFSVRLFDNGQQGEGSLSYGNSFSTIRLSR